ncbi:MAG TPA: thioredoxin domain-containing protein [Longimicrobium sp.]|nr:thioredoxin domain-containing protein [Longimicrobium sp.]
MNRLRPGPALLAAVLLVSTAAGACAQSDAAPAAARAPALSPDSLLARADRGRSKGPADAAVTLVEVSDFQCPYCREFATTTYARLDSAYLRGGRVRMVYINYPLPTHPEAFAAAEAAMCASVQGKFWELHDRLFATQREWGGQADAARRFAGFAREAGLDMAAWTECVDNDRTAALIVGDAMQASGAGINGTPTFVLNSRAGSKALSGAIPFEQLSRELDALLAAPAAPAAPTPPAP